MAGSRVALPGGLGAELRGYCCAVPADDLTSRWVLFDGEQEPILVPLAWLRRLP